MASLESDNQGLMEQFEEVRQKLEKTSKTSTKKLLDGHVSYMCYIYNVHMYVQCHRLRRN